MVQYGAAVCKRGHIIEDEVVDPQRGLVGEADLFTTWSTREAPKFCKLCGAPVILVCEACGAAIPGSSVISIIGTEPDAFCGACGNAFPWASREQRLGRLYNLIDYEEGLDEADRLKVIEAIAVMSEPEPEPDDDQRFLAAAETVRSLAPGAWKAAQPVIATVVSAWLRQKLNLP